MRDNRSRTRHGKRLRFPTNFHYEERKGRYRAKTTICDTDGHRNGLSKISIDGRMTTQAKFRRQNINRCNAGRGSVDRQTDADVKPSLTDSFTISLHAVADLHRIAYHRPRNRELWVIWVRRNFRYG